MNTCHVHIPFILVIHASKKNPKKQQTKNPLSPVEMVLCYSVYTFYPLERILFCKYPEEQLGIEQKSSKSLQLCGIHKILALFIQSG